MNIQEMHATFRVMGQQMGMQLVRGILDESIDVFINAVIVEKTQLELLTSLRTVLQETVDSQNATLSPINLYRNLYKSAKYKVSSNYGKKVIDDTTVYYPDESDLCLNYNKTNGYHEFYIPTMKCNDFINGNNKYDYSYFLKGLDHVLSDKDNLTSTDEDKKALEEIRRYVRNYGKHNNLINSNERFINPMLYLGVSVTYMNPNDTRNQLGSEINCRLVGAEMLETTMRDFCNGASKDYPVASILSYYPGQTDNDLSVGTEYVQIYTNTKDLVIDTIEFKYIKQPNVVKYDNDLSKCVNCDLPEYSHFEIVERAVQKFFNAIANTTGQARQNDRNQ